MIRIAVLISRTGSNMEAIVNACKEGRIDGEVVVVGSDNLGAKGLVFAEECGIPTFIADYKTPIREWKAGSISDADKIKKVPADFSFTDVMKKQSIFTRTGALDDSFRAARYFYPRAVAEAQILAGFKRYDPIDLVVLAGYMRVFTPYIIDRINVGGAYRIMNIHPALLPAFPGTDGYGDTFNYGCKVGGCTVHFVDYVEDTGPIIGQCAYEILETDTLESIKEKGLKLEWELYPKCIQLFAGGRLKVIENEKGRKIVKTLPEK